jgi:hypothetical protein
MLFEVPAVAVSGEFEERNGLRNEREQQRLINGHTTSDGGQQGTSRGCIIVSKQVPRAYATFPMGYPRGAEYLCTLTYEWLRSLQRRPPTCNDWPATFDSLYEVHKYCKLSRGNEGGCEAEPRRMAEQLRQDWQTAVYVLRYVSK